MKKQSGYGGFPATLLTLSLLLLVLAVGFVVGRLVVARAYVTRAPKFDLQAARGPDVSEDTQGEQPSAPGRVYVPPPAPPERTGDEEEALVVGYPPAEVELEGAALSALEPAQPAEPSTGSARRETAPAEPARPAPTPEAAPAPPPRETRRQPPAVEKPSQQVYAIQVGVFASRQGARRVVDELARAGYQARIEPEKRGAQELYRVVTGRYTSEYAARKVVERLRSDGFDAFLVQQ